MGFFWAEVRAKKRRRVSKGSCREWQKCSCSRRDTNVPRKITGDAQGPLPSMCTDVTPASTIVSELLLLPFLSLLQYFSSVAQPCPSVTQEPQHTRPPCPSPTPGIHPNSCPLSQWGHPTISSSVVPFSSCPQSLPASGSFPMSQLFTSGAQSIGVSASASVLPMNIQDWSPLGWTGWISVQSKGLSNT